MKELKIYKAVPDTIYIGMCSLLVLDTLRCCASSSAYTVTAGAPAIQTTFQATVKAKGFLPVESALVRILLCRSSQHCLFTEPGFLDICDCKRDLEMTFLFQTVSCPRGESGHKEEESVGFF